MRDLRAIQLNSEPFTHDRLNAHTAQQLKRRGNILKMWQVADNHRAIGQKGWHIR